MKNVTLRGLFLNRAGIPASLLTVVKGLYDALTEEAGQQIVTIEQQSTQKIEAIKTELTATKADNAALHSNNHQLNDDIAKLNQQHCSLEANYQVVQQKLIEQQSENQSQTARLNDKAEEIQRISKQIQHAQDNLEHYRETIRQQREEERQAYEAKINRLENKNDENTKVVSELKCLLETQKKENEQLKMQAETLQNKLEQAQRDQSHKNELIQKSQIVLDALKKSYHQLETCANEKEKISTELTQANLELKINIATLDEKIKNDHQSLIKAEDKINQLHNEKLFIAKEKSELEYQVKQFNS